MMADIAEQWDPLVIASSALRSGSTSDEGTTRDQCRSRRKRPIRSKTLNIKRLTQLELAVGRALYPETGYWRPRTRAECVDSERPCPYVGCQYHLYLSVDDRNGSIRISFPDLEPWELTESCALDVADRGGTILEDIGAMMNLTRERIRQIAEEAVCRLPGTMETERLREYHEVTTEEPARAVVRREQGCRVGELDAATSAFRGL